MAKLEKPINLSRDADKVWAYVSDYANDPAWREGVVEMIPTPDGPARPGTRTHEVLRFTGSTYVTDADIKEVQDRHLRYEGSNASGTLPAG